MPEKLPLLTLTVVSFLGFAALAAGQSRTLRSGDQLQVNTYTTTSQDAPSVAAAPNGTFVVVWQSYRGAYLDDSNSSVHGRLVAADGTPVGDPFQVNTYTTSTQQGPDVATDGAGNFIVVFESWGSYGSDSIYNSIQAQRYASDGSPIGTQFQVNDYTTGTQGFPAVASDAAGNFVVIWDSSDSDNGDTSSDSVQGQRFDSTGAPVGNQFLVNTYTTDGQGFADVDMNDQGQFVAVWYGNTSEGGSGYPIFGRVFGSDGNPVGNDFVVNADTASYAGGPAVAVGPTGDFVVTWHSFDPTLGDPVPGGIAARRYASDGSPVGDAFLVNTYTVGSQMLPDVTVDDRGDLVFVWRSNGSENGDTSSHSIQMKRYSSSGTVLDSQVLVNTYTTGRQSFAAVAAAPGGDFVVAWQSYGSPGTDSDGNSVQSQAFLAAIFMDGFESGDTSRWSQ